MNVFKTILIACPMILNSLAQAQWQQRVSYEMDIDFDVTTHRYTGTQSLTYSNNSPDTLRRVFYHLFYNAFQPGSAMYNMHRNLVDPDMRLLQIALLAPEDQGYLKVKSLKQDGAGVKFIEDGTILEVDLAQPILPGQSSTLQMEFNGQVPIIVRRAGRNNGEGISYSMAQWYPKLSVYDQDGWHPDPYQGYEFYGDFGDFDVEINIDSKYILGATGILQNANEIGCGYEKEGATIAARSGKSKWHFVGKNVHDFTWAADPDYTHQRFKRKDGLEVHYLFQKGESTTENWTKLPEIMDFVFDFLNANYGKYPYPVYSFIQAGDGGMEYPMLTLITGHRSLESLVGVSVHELVHSWYHGVLATNELRSAWMDEGFTNYLTAITMRAIRKKGLLPSNPESPRTFSNDYNNYIQLTKLNVEEPLSTHANLFKTTTAYYASAYSKGCVFLAQMEYLLGEEMMQRVMLRYFNTWKFRHPGPLDFIHVAELESGMVLDWYYEYWILSTKTIDYAFKTVEEANGGTLVTISRKGLIPMPVEFTVTTKKGQQLNYYIPLNLMRGIKPQATGEGWEVLKRWDSTAPEYTLTLPLKFNQVAELEIDVSGKMADVHRDDNSFMPEGSSD